ncbi:hypothetical protein HID58_090129 [Brassica napus]|uniref:Sugar phosphate transporter domain-containing protein n=1 Tax=Brassica napus TaxID=3708 RepID=A0ABQ7XE31_BRANA|nr:hypothetical protein HID58_090129 [Brassica napus]
MGLVDSLFVKDARKFLKRKDSDAAEAEIKNAALIYPPHIACDELWKNSEALYTMSSKHQKELNDNNRDSAAPVVAMSFNFVVAVGIILANKLVKLTSLNLKFFFVSLSVIKLVFAGDGRVGFNFPIFLTLIHYAVAWILLAFFKSLSLLPMSPPSKTTPFSSLFSLGAVMAFASGLANTASNTTGSLLNLASIFNYSYFQDLTFCLLMDIKRICSVFSSYLTLESFCFCPSSVGFYQMAKIAVTPTIVLAEFVLFKKTLSSTKVMALAVVSLGVAIATVTDLEFNLLMWKTTPFTVFFLLALMPWLDPPGVCCSNGIGVTLLQSSSRPFLAFFSSGLVHSLSEQKPNDPKPYGMSLKVVNRATSATSHVVLGQFKTCVILLGGYVIFGSDPGFVSICGAVAALAGMSVYTWLNLPGKSVDYSSSKLLPKQNTAVSKPKADSDDVGGESGVALLSVELDLSKTTTANIV